MFGNWIDWVFVAFVVYAAVDGWRRGLLALLANLFSFLGSLWFAIRLHSVVGGFFTTTFGLTEMWSTVLGYLAVGAVSQLIIETIALIALQKLPAKIFESKANVWMGSVVSVLNAVIVSAFLLLLMLALPLRGTVRDDIRASVLASRLVRLADTYGGQVRSSLQDLAHTAAKFLTVEPGSNESIPLDVPPDLTNLSVSKHDESVMVGLVNSERASRGLQTLTVDDRLTANAEEKSKDMLVRRYFSHYSPDGKNASIRLQEAGIPFSLVGENLAYAPDVTTAHQGLMNSEGHRENILEKRFRRVGIGVIDAGVYGKMFTQIFTD